MAAREAEPFDYEMECAKEAGSLAVAELLNKREEEAKRKSQVAVLATSVAPESSRSSKLSAEAAWYEAGHFLEVWGRWNRKGAERTKSPLPKGARSQFTPPAEAPPIPDESDMSAYVERGPGFARSQATLWRVYVLGWTDPSASAQATIDTFRRSLARQIQETPWKPLRRHVALCEADRMHSKQSDEEWAKAGKVERQKASSHRG